MHTHFILKKWGDKTLVTQTFNVILASHNDKWMKWVLGWFRYTPTTQVTIRLCRIYLLDLIRNLHILKKSAWFNGNVTLVRRLDLDWLDAEVMKNTCSWFFLFLFWYRVMIMIKFTFHMDTSKILWTHEPIKEEDTSYVTNIN